MAAHLIWKIRLTEIVNGAGGKCPDCTAVGRDDLCDFGKWIHGAGSKYKMMAAYDDVVSKHAHFHNCAAEVVRKMEDGDKAGAMTAMDGAFESASRQLINAVAELRTEVSANRPASTCRGRHALMT
jgi:hypothetical protein